MSRYYSQSASGFLSDALHPTLPADAVAISDQLYADLLAGLNSGQTIAMVNGQPQLQPVVVTQAQLTASLVAHANAKQLALRDGGITVNVGSASTADEVNVASDADGRTLVTGCVQLIGVASQASQPAPTFQWINNDGTQLSLTSTQIMTIALKLGTFVQATYTTLGAVLAAIAAGTITTSAQIDTLAASVGTWPATSY